MRSKTILLILFLTVCRSLNANEADTTMVEPPMFPLWTTPVPGGAYFYQGKVAQGITFATLQTGLIYAGIKYDKSLRFSSTTPYYNYPLLLGLQTIVIEKMPIFRNDLELYKINNPDFRYDDISMRDLYLAPFKRENIFTPITGGMIMLALVFLGIDQYNATSQISNVDQMYFMDRYIDRDPALAAFGAVSMAASWGAGVGEEYMMRNCIMPHLDYRLGQRKGLIYSSLLFGSIHMGNLAFAEDPDVKAALYQSGLATVLGYFLGRDVQRRDYKIGPAVAAHTWYNFTLFLGAMLINPEDNYFGVNVKFDF